MEDAPPSPAQPDSAFAEVYAELRSLASAWWHARRGGDTLQPTALVHEAFLKLAQGGDRQYADEEHFRATAARAMRQALVSHARSKGRQKRGGGWDRVTLSGVGTDAGLNEVDLLTLEDALGKLERLDAHHARVIELRFFAGLTEPQIARAMQISERTVSSYWRAARAWLLSELAGPD